MQAKDLILERKKKKKMMIMMTRFNFSSFNIDIFSKSFISETLAKENKFLRFADRASQYIYISI